MEPLTLPQAFSPAHLPVRDIKALLEERKTFGERASDWLATAVGSWNFIMGQSVLPVKGKMSLYRSFLRSAWNES